jgi:hypothetical protein
MVIELVPFENEQSPQIGIFEELAIRFVTIFVPASYLTGLIISILAFKSIQYGKCSMAILPCCNTRKMSTYCTFAERLPSYRTRDTL